MVGWALKRMPSREALLAQRWARPFARVLGHPAIWRWNRRAVARGMALGLFFGFVVPLMQTPVAAIFALPARANLAVAGLATFVTNPFTTPVIYLAGYAVGVAALGEPASGDGVGGALGWLLTAGGRTWIGLLVFGTVGAIIGFVATHLAWRWRVARRWRARRYRIAPQPV